MLLQLLSCLLVATTVLSAPGPISGTGFQCLTCENAGSFEECANKATKVTCTEGPDMGCEMVVRVRNETANKSFQVSRHCKQQRACNNNMKQNRHSCIFTNNHYECWCCCNTHLCNFTRDCAGATPYCSRTLPDPPINGIVDCGEMPSGGFLEGHTCRYQCNEGSELQGGGATTTTCVGESFNETAPTCVPSDVTPVCIKPEAPLNGDVLCGTSLPNGTYKIGHECTYVCNRGYKLDGEKTATCKRLRDLGVFLPVAPRCEASECAFLDLLIILDSSSSIGPEDWYHLVNFTAQLLNTLEIGETQTKVALFRYSDIVFEDHAILFSSPASSDLEEIESRLENDYQYILQPGTNTDVALRYAREVVFDGDRSDAPNRVVLFTDGRAQNQAAAENQASLLRDQANAKIYVVGFQTGGVPLQVEHFQKIIGEDGEFINLEEGFQGLTNTFKDTLSTLICEPDKPIPCGKICPESPKNGYVDCGRKPPGGFPEGHTCTFQCNSGYVLRDCYPVTTTCVSGRFNETTPECIIREV